MTLPKSELRLSACGGARRAALPVIVEFLGLTSRKLGLGEHRDEGETPSRCLADVECPFTFRASDRPAGLGLWLRVRRCFLRRRSTEDKLRLLRRLVDGDISSWCCPRRDIRSPSLAFESRPWDAERSPLRPGRGEIDTEYIPCW